jgi:4,5-dihydroxyphthalate decarboxylase
VTARTIPSSGPTTTPAGPRPPLRFSCGSFIRTLPLLQGEVSVEGSDLRVVPDPFPASGLLEDYQARRNLLMSEQRAFDICEMGLAPLLAAKSKGHDLVAIPVFHYRRFRHSAIVCRTASRIRNPEDLVGKRVGLRRLSLSAGIWARGLLEHEHAVPLDRINWFVQVETPLRPQVRDRLNITQVPADEPLERLLERGEIDATIEAYAITPLRESSPSVHTLFSDPTAAEIDYYRRSRIFPIMHTVVMRQPLIDRCPDLPASVHAAFAQAKVRGAADPRRPTRYVLAEEERLWLDGLTPAQRLAFLGDDLRHTDPWKYSLTDDRRTVETFLDYAFEQGISNRRYALEELFAASTLNF